MNDKELLLATVFTVLLLNHKSAKLFLIAFVVIQATNQLKEFLP